MSAPTDNQGLLLGERWTSRDWRDGRLFSLGDPSIAPTNAEFSELADLFEAPGFRALVLDTPAVLLAGVDHCRSHPLFYAHISNQFRLTDDPRRLAARLDEGWALEAALEAAMSGYVTGRQTLHPEISQLRAGEMLRYDKRSGELTFARHYVHDQQPVEQDEQALVDAFWQVTNAAFRHTLDKADGRPIFVPLSGGLDSRLVLAKLKEMGAPHLFSFSYGPKSNTDATAAKEVAERLGVPWRFVPTPGRRVADFFSSDARRAYWRFADGLCSVPNNQDLLPLIIMRENGWLPDDAMLVNGQTGDFISGGHVPAALMQPKAGWDDLFAALADKHYGLWLPLKTKENLALMRHRMQQALELGDPLPETADENLLTGLNQRWEFEERQAKYIVNGQRIYDHLGLAWDLPLWDRNFCSFWRSVPVHWKFRQKLYRKALAQWDHAELFSRFDRTVSAWGPLMTAAITPMAVATRLIAGRTRRDRLFRYANYFDRFGNHYAAFGFRQFAHHAQELRNPVSLYTRCWLEELGAWESWRR